MRSHYKIISLMLLLTFLLTECTLAEEFVKDERKGAGVTVATDKLTYKSGEPIQITLSVFNTTESDTTFHFRNSQRYDFSVEVNDGDLLWRWSDGRMFAMVLGTEVMGTEKNKIVYRETYKGDLEPGYYKIRGIFVARDKPMGGSLIVRVDK